MNYYIKENNKIVLFDENKNKLENTLNFMPQFKNSEILETDKEIIEFQGEFVFREDIEAQLLEAQKEEKLKENEIIRDNALNYGVEYKGILFDSDTDQKVNLSDTYSRLKDGETITWLGKNNEKLECKKEDLWNIGELIRYKTSTIWMINAQIKEEIASAQSVEELEKIEIEYD